LNIYIPSLFLQGTGNLLLLYVHNLKPRLLDIKIEGYNMKAIQVGFSPLFFYFFKLTYFEYASYKKSSFNLWSVIHYVIQSTVLFGVRTRGPGACSTSTMQLEI